MIVPIDFAHGPSEAAPLIRKRFETNHSIDRRDALQPVVVDNCSEIPQTVMPRE